MHVTPGDERFEAALRRASAHSSYLRTQAGNFPSVSSQLEKGEVEEALSEALAAGEGAPSAGIALRRRRNAVALALGVGDLADLLPLERVVRSLSDLADDSLDQAVREAIRERTPDAEPRGFAVIGLGKLGSRELNYSSDVDVIFLFDPDTLPLKPGEEPERAAVRIGQRVVELLQKRDMDGYAFRVDLRLRPSPEVTPIALSLNAAISYYESHALAWERAAFIRSRAVAGDPELGEQFLTAVQPFVWRRSLDFGAVREVLAISDRIRDHYAQGQAFGPGYDLKRGRGGIREIEFFAQVHQLIHGGRDPMLRAPATLDALAVLAAAGHISADDAETLSKAYRLLRTIEHRLQMVDDRQTHSLPSDPAALDNIARLHGLDGGAALLALLQPTVASVAAIYDQLQADDRRGLPRDPATLEARLAKAGYEDAAVARARIEGWRSGQARSLRTAAARDAFEAMLPALIDAFGASPEPMVALNRFDDLVTRLPGGVNFYSLLEARPGLASVLALLLSHAPALADELGRRAELLDGLIDATAFEPPPAVADLAREFGRRERTPWDYQALLDAVRRRVNERRFALGAQLVARASDPLEVAAGYARVAEAAIEVLVRATVEEFEAKHGRVPGSELVILGLGRLGGQALTHASDLDLIYLFTGTHEAQSDGSSPLGATHYFNRLGQRVSAALSVQTAAGPLYAVDTRLRPSGTDGLLAVSLDSFAAYQREKAWTWEHMALTRARPVYGSPEARKALSDIVDAVLRAPRDPDKLRGDAVQMRRDMAAHKPPAGPFDVKLGDGGLVDLEFAIHLLQLSRGVGLTPKLEDALDALAGEGLAPGDVADALRLLTSMLVTFRLVCPKLAAPAEASRPLISKACGFESWDDLVAAHADARQRVSAFWRGVAGEEME